MDTTQKQHTDKAGASAVGRHQLKNSFDNPNGNGYNLIEAISPIGLTTVFIVGDIMNYNNQSNKKNPIGTES